MTMLTAEDLEHIGPDNIGHQPHWVREATVAAAKQFLSAAKPLETSCDHVWENLPSPASLCTKCWAIKFTCIREKTP